MGKNEILVFDRSGKQRAWVVLKENYGGEREYRDIQCVHEQDGNVMISTRDGVIASFSKAKWAVLKVGVDE